MNQLPEVIRTIERVSPDVVHQAATFQAAILADVAGRRGTMHARVAPVHERMQLAGPAFTVEVRPGDNLMIHKALEIAQPGDVIVVDAQGDVTNSITGEIMMTEACKKGIAGVVVDGAVRDSEALSELAMPVYAAGVNPKGPYKDGPGEINVPVSLGGVVVNPGDIIVGDADGIVVIAPADAPELLGKAQAKFQKEQEIFRAIEAGTRDKSWIDRDLKARGCEVIDDYCK